MTGRGTLATGGRSLAAARPRRKASLLRRQVRRPAVGAAWSAFLQAGAEDRPPLRHLGLAECEAGAGEDSQLRLAGGNADEKAVGLDVADSPGARLLLAMIGWATKQQSNRALTQITQRSRLSHRLHGEVSKLWRCARSRELELREAQYIASPCNLWLNLFLCVICVNACFLDYLLNFNILSLHD
jgi:hypothetical protein